MIVHPVTIQIRRPTSTDPGQVSTGYYIINGDVLIMTHGDGTPVDEHLFRHTLRPSDIPAAVAAVLARAARRHLNGTTEEGEAFNRPLEYKNEGLA